MPDIDKMFVVTPPRNGFDCRSCERKDNEINDLHTRLLGAERRINELRAEVARLELQSVNLHNA